MRTVGKGSLYCFSPPVMLATFVLEVALALYVLWRYKLDRIGRLIVLLLVLLAVFQLAEYMVCGGWGASGDAWARLGYGAITFLPPLGIQLAYTIANKSNKWLMGGSYVLAICFAAYFLLAANVFGGNECVGNYVIFQLGTVAAQLYTLYYYGLLVAGVVACLRLAQSTTSKRRRALVAFGVGYVLFMVPTTIANTIDPSTIAGIPSIMCGFAVLLAGVVALWVLPLVGRYRNGAGFRSRKS